MDTPGQVGLTETMQHDDPRRGQRRVVIEGVTPALAAGRFPIKRTVGENIEVEADIFCDGHDNLGAVLRYRKEQESTWHETPMTLLGNDRWRGVFTVSELGRYRYSISAWVDSFASWRHDLRRRVQAEDQSVALLLGSRLIEAAARRARADDAKNLHAWAAALQADDALATRIAIALSDELAHAMARYPDRELASELGEALSVVVERERARFSAWYELFPRSCITSDEEHGTLQNCEERLADIAAMGFDIVYLPPVHPIGRTHRKGRNNTLMAGPKDPGSPWAIGSADGGHKAIHPQLGTIEDFRSFVSRARELGMEVALDIAFQCSPDHPYVKEHPQWFKWRPDGSVQYAENPPKKYQDIYPFNFETDDWRDLWEELKSVFLYWISEGIETFRVDNPHTKPFAFWEWVIAEIKREHPQVIFLAEAFARPKTMYRLAKLGFTQSYTYFTWRNTKWELVDYMHELSRPEVRDFFRPNFWPNTPDILSEYLQFGDRPAFMTRVVLAATLAANYGIYGPAYELTEHRAREPGSEEYLDSEKYQIRLWPTRHPESLAEFIGRINRIRRDNPALQSDRGLAFYTVDNDELICYGKVTDPLDDIIVVVANLDVYHAQSGWVDLPLEELGIDPRHPYQMHDLLSGSRYLWHGSRNYVELDPQRSPAHIFRLRRKVRTERDFDYYF